MRTSAENHNEFINQAIVAVGQRMLKDSTFSEQMVMLESLVAGLLGATLVLAGKEAHANEHLSALTHGVRGRLPLILTCKP